MNIFSINEGPKMTAKECIIEILAEDIRGNTKGVSTDLASGFEAYMGNDKVLSNFALTAINVLNKGYDRIFRSE
jgi:hypothetical protein